MNVEQLTGPVERVSFHNADSGFCVLRVKVKGHKDLVTVVGINASVNAGEQIEATGTWFNDRQYGLQFKSHNLRTIPPSTLEGMERYLGSGLIKGIGPHFAARLVKAFKTEVFDVIENDPNRLLEVNGIGQGRLNKIVRGWSDQKIIREIMVFLQSHGVGTLRAVRIYKTYGENAISIVRENPYRLASDIRGIGFKTADQLAMQLGILPDSILRARAGLQYTLLELSSQGHCAYPQEELVQAAVTLLEIDEAVIQNALQDEVRENNLVTHEVDDDHWVYLPHLFYAEEELASSLTSLASGTHPLPSVDIEKALQWVQKKTGLELSSSQQDAIRQAVQSKVLVITGGPGVGKTTLVNSILKIFQAKDLQCLLCAPTGRAAKRLAESTGLEAKTIHRLLEFDPKQGRFTRDRENPLKGDVLIVDETSMVDLVLMNKLIQAVPSDAAVLLVGDVDQLPSVGPGSVLEDIIQSETFSVIRLTEVFRQAAQSRIITNAHRINQGNMPELQPPKEDLSDFYFIEAGEPEQVHDVLLRLIQDRIPQRFQIDPRRDIQVLTPMNRSGLGGRALNVELQKALNPQEIGFNKFGNRYSPGDKVIQVENNYEKDVFNGDIGVITALDEAEQELTVLFDDRPVVYDINELDELNLAYACTIHKSQGSEYPVVILVLHTQHYQMLQRNLIYTGVTRGKKLVVVVGSKKAMWIALKRGDMRKRFTQLKQRIQNQNVSL